MTYLSRHGAIIKIRLLQNSSARNYFETNERLFLNTVLNDLENSQKQLDESTIRKFERIYQKYSKFI